MRPRTRATGPPGGGSADMSVVTPERAIRESDDWNDPGPGNKLSNENVPSGPRARGGADCRCGGENAWFCGRP